MNAASQRVINAANEQLAVAQRQLAENQIRMAETAAMTQQILEKIKSISNAFNARTRFANVAASRPEARPAVPIPAKRGISNSFPDEDKRIDLEYLYRLFGGKENLLKEKSAVKGGVRATRRLKNKRRNRKTKHRL